MIKHLICAIALTALFIGCVTPEILIWDKPGATQSDYDKDSYECEKDVRQSGYYGGGIAGYKKLREFFKKCMISKGWTLRTDPSTLGGYESLKKMKMP